MTELSYLCAAFAVSTIVFAVLYFWERRKIRKRKADITAQEMLHDIMSGGAILKIQVINPENLILRSPRG
jgi:hypothetical protein